jgi:hypothetical protein
MMSPQRSLNPSREIEKLNTTGVTEPGMISLMWTATRSLTESSCLSRSAMFLSRWIAISSRDRS